MAQRLIIPPDTFAELFTKFNQNADSQAASISVSQNGTIEVFNDEDVLLFDFASGGAKSFVQTGLTVSAVAGSISAALTAVQVVGGSYAFENERYSVDTANYALEPPDLTYPRYDAVRANASGVSILTGTPSATPVPPEPNGILLAYVYVPAYGGADFSVIQNNCCPVGQFVGQKQIFDGTQFVAAFNIGLLKISTTPYVMQPIAERVVFIAGAAVVELDDTTLYDGLQYTFINSSGGAVDVDAQSKTIGGGSSTITILTDVSFTLMYSVNTDNWRIVSKS